MDQERDFREFAVDEPEVFLEIIFATLDQSDREVNEEFPALTGRLAREEGVNLYRVINQHPEYVEERLGGQSLQFDREMVEKIDEFVPDSMEVVPPPETEPE